MFISEKCGDLDRGTELIWSIQLLVCKHKTICFICVCLSDSEQLNKKQTITFWWGSISGVDPGTLQSFRLQLTIIF